MFKDFQLIGEHPASIQVKDYIKRLILKGALQAGQKLPSTRELGGLLNVSRNTVIAAYADLEADGFVYVLKGKGSYVAALSGSVSQAAPSWQMDWTARLNGHARMAEQLDLMKHGIRADRGTISFTSIAPDEKLFDLDNVKRAFLDRMSVEGNVLLNYGYAKGYKPLMDYLLRYMDHKGVDLQGKDILITNGFTEGFDLVLSALSRPGGTVICENPTHHTALKNLKLHGFNITGIAMEQGGINLRKLEEALEQRAYDCGYFVPSYHNPTGMVMSPEKRLALMKLMKRYQVPIIEDGFNEELRYSGSHVSPLIAAAGPGNHVIYIGSFSKVLFPGLRVGWVLADRKLIYYLESIKRARTIHTSTLDQSILYQYLVNGNLEKYLKKAKTEYKRKYEWTLQCCEEHIPYTRLTGDGGLHLFVTFPDDFDSRELLEACQKQGVIFTPGDIFFTDGRGRNTMRIGFSRVSDEDIGRGIRIIGETAKQMIGSVGNGNGQHEDE
ncbi:aminotransferase-like domain-containing protein [Paenibacillus nasutitermitis]|uniref:GntR family transcriptional regulator n=1 Tax=Paenibacillus nasutitermitis TaxID=1652958 RepID=A0A916ZD18_9BACL|nr:PLP-dependent aminotransferase family protein [Paenibacillus nasutitermitis]GGD89137.1 GntR family transcriptional regulator [Paenibacillus nasutitermitis]